MRLHILFLLGVVLQCLCICSVQAQTRTLYPNPAGGWYVIRDLDSLAAITPQWKEVHVHPANDFLNAPGRVELNDDGTIVVIVYPTDRIFIPPGVPTYVPIEAEAELESRRIIPTPLPEKSTFVSTNNPGVRDERETLTPRFSNVQAIDVLTAVAVLAALAILVLRFLKQRGRGMENPLTSGPAWSHGFPGGDREFDAARERLLYIALMDTAAEYRADPEKIPRENFLISAIEVGRAHGTWAVTYADGTSQLKLLRGESIYAARVRDPLGVQVGAYCFASTGCRVEPFEKFRVEAERTLAPPPQPPALHRLCGAVYDLSIPIGGSITFRRLTDENIRIDAVPPYPRETESDLRIN